MTPDPNLPIPPRIQVEPVVSENNSTRLLRYLLAGNPFYIVSAVLLLLSMRKLSLDSRVFPEEIPQLLFNFSSFQIYELLLIGTAIFLARRKIWYDSGLLVALENLFLFVPFILISQALMIKGSIALLLCLSGCFLAILRTGSLKQWLPQFDFNKRLFLIGTVLLAVNVILPTVVQSLHSDSNSKVWSDRGAWLQMIEWFVIAPLAVGSAILLIRGKRKLAMNEAFFTKRYFPLMVLLFWIGGTAAHFYCIDYVYLLPWKISLLTPALWVAAWTVSRRHFEVKYLDLDLEPILRKFLFVSPVIVLGVAAFKNDWSIVFTLTTLNALIYFFMALKGQNGFALRMSLVSTSTIFGSMPANLMSAMHIDYPRGEMLWLGALGYVIVTTLLSRDARAAILGGIATIAFVGTIAADTVEIINPALQTGIIFFLLHSLRWNGSQKGEASVRALGAAFWFAHSLMWVGTDSMVARHGVYGAAAGVIAVYFLARWVFRKWGSRIIPLAAMAVSAVPTACDTVKFLKEAPSGLLILLGSFVLFAIGTIAALTKSRWHSQEQIHPTAVEQKEAI